MRVQEIIGTIMLANETCLHDPSYAPSQTNSHNTTPLMRHHKQTLTTQPLSCTITTLTTQPLPCTITTLSTPNSPPPPSHKDLKLSLCHYPNSAPFDRVRASSQKCTSRIPVAKTTDNIVLLYYEIDYKVGTTVCFDIVYIYMNRYIANETDLVCFIYIYKQISM